MKKIIYLVLLVFVAFFSCKKDIKQTVAPVSAQAFEDSMFTPAADFTFLSTAGSSHTTVDTAYYYMPATVKGSISKSSLTASYAWYFRRTGLPDSLISTSTSFMFTYPDSLTNASVVLLVKNNLWIDTIIHPFRVKNAPTILKITGITIDTMSFINPATSAFWNASAGNNGANVFCQMYDGTNLIMDTVKTNAGWTSNPAVIATIYPVKENVITAPFAIKYPTGINRYIISSAIPGVNLLHTFKIRIYNKNLVGVAPDLIGEVDLIPQNYFGGTPPTTLYINNPVAGLYLKLTVIWA